MARPIADAISAGLAALARMQAADGSFPLQAGPMGAPWRPCGPLFSTAYIMLGAGGLLPADTIASAVGYILGQRRADGLWVYDPAIPVPPDADVTACALAALCLHDSVPDGKADAALLRAFWRTDAGRFRTWNAPGIWSLPERDDPAVNCNILFALRLLGAPATPEEQAAVVRFLQSRKRGSRYYCAPSTIAHAAWRAGLGTDALPAVATASPPVNDLLGCAQFLCATDARDAELIRFVLTVQRRDGSWPQWPWVMAMGRTKTYWGSAAISTALAIEALDRHSGHSLQQKRASRSPL